MLENFKKALDRGNSVNAIFFTENHDILIAKLEAYGVSAKSLFCIHNYLNRQMSLQKTDVSCDCCLWKKKFLKDLLLVLFYSYLYY